MLEKKIPFWPIGRLLAVRKSRFSLMDVVPKPDITPGPVEPGKLVQ